MSNFSFDIVSEVDKSEINNVFDQVQREMNKRYDFKNKMSSIEWLSDAKDGFKLIADSDMQIDAIIEIIRKKLSSRNLSQKLINVDQENVTSGMNVTKIVPFVVGINKDQSKDLSSKIRNAFPKVKIAIIAESLRISSSSKNELQAIIKLIRELDLDYPVQINNFR